MADKTYKMVVTLSNGSTVDAGTFVAPQGPQGPEGPQGPAGPSGALGEWTNGTADTRLADGTYLIAYEMGTAIVEVPFTGKQVLFSGGNALTDFCELYFGEFSESLTSINRVEIRSGQYSFETYDPAPQYKFIRLK